MKSIVVLPLILIAVTVAAILHATKPNESKQELNIEKLGGGLKGLNGVIRRNTNLTIRMFDADVEPYLCSRYVLAYPYGPADKADKFDTVINICPVNTNDSILHSITNQRKVIWSNRDDQYQYFLTCKN